MSDRIIKTVDAPNGLEGQGFFAGKLDDFVGLARANSLWPLPFATSCCGIELWQLRVHTTIFHDLVQKECHSRHVRQIF